VKKVVVTSSIVAISSGHLEKNEFSEKDWTIPEASPPYDKSKCLAEREAWKIYEDNKDKLRLTVINPGFILGPTFTTENFTSAEFFVSMFRREFPGVPKICWDVIDVRDCALAHVRALEKPESDGKRYILASGPMWMREMGQILQGEFGKYGYRFNADEMRYCTVKIASWCDSRAKFILPYWDRKLIYDNSACIKDLDMKFTDKAQTIKEMCYSLIEKKIIQEDRVSVSQKGADKKGKEEEKKDKK